MATFTGTNGNDTLPPVGADTSGDDIIKPLLGQDTVDGGSGEDLLIIDYSSNTFTGGGGYDAGLVSQINDDGSGSFSGYFYAYNDSSGTYDQVDFSNIERFQITGTNQNDYIQGGWKNDILNGGGGDDTFYSLDGIDQIDGGTGIDTLQYTNLSGTTANLSIDGLGTAITLANGISIKNIERFNNLWTGYGNDTITFSARYDETIKTSNGNDTINAGLGKDNVDGQKGSDTLIVNYSSNTYAGGISYGAGIGSSYSGNGAGGWNGYLYAYYADDGNSYDQVYFYNVEKLNITGTGFGDYFSYGGYGSISIDGGAGIDTIGYADFSAATTALTIDNSGLTITQANGTVVKNVEQFSNLYTGSGNDTVTFTDTNNKQIYTGSGNDTIATAASNDNIYSQDGNDTINAGLGYDNVYGGTGNDLLIIDYSANTWAGDVNYGAGITGDAYNAGDGGVNGYFRAYTDSSGNYNQVNFANIERFKVIGTKFDDFIDLWYSATQVDIDGGLGTDILDEADFSSSTNALTIDNSGATITSTSSNGTTVKNVEQFNNLWMGSGNDTVTFTDSGNKQIYTGSGNDTITTAGGNDSIYGQDGNDTINAGLGQNYVDGGAGNDTLNIDYSSNTYAGGTSYGASIYTYNYTYDANGWDGYVRAYYADEGNSYDQVRYDNVEKINIKGTSTGDYFDNGGYSSISIDGGAGVDTINYADFSAETAALTIDSSGGTITQANGTVVKNVEQFNYLYTGSGNDTVTFTDTNNKQIYTGSGNDTITTAGGNDSIYGRDGNDTINAGLGQNYVDGGAGNDTLNIDYSSNTYAGGTSYGAGIYTYNYTYDANGWDGYVTVYYADDYYSYDQVRYDNVEKINIKGTSAGDYFHDGGLGISIDGGAGIDTIDYANFSTETTGVTIDSSGGTITLANGTAVIKNVEQFNNLYLGSGDDTITSGLGKDYVDGGAGSDTLNIDYSSNTYAGGTSYGAGASTYNYTYDANGWDGYVIVYYANDGNSYDQVRYDNIEKINIKGTSAGDYFHDGGLGISIDGGAGIDIIEYADFSDITTGVSISNGSATQTFSNGSKITSVEQFNNLYTGSGNDTVTLSGNFSDRIYTGAGDDSINAGLGQDTVYGDLGSDLLIIDYSANTWAGNSTYAAGLTGDAYDADDGGVSGYFRAYTDSSGNYNQVNFSNIERFKVVGTKFNDFIDLWYSATQVDIDGGLGTDTLDEADFSSATNALTIANAGATITASNGSVVKNVEQFNYLSTGSGNDTINFSIRYNENINTGTGDDTINSGLGRDSVDGSTGNDLLILNYSSNTYTGGTSYGAGINSSISSNGSDGWNGYFYAYYANNGNYDEVDFYNIERFQITGTGQADVINTGSGNDIISGGAGNDTIWSGGGTDTVDGGTGTDTLADTDFSDVITNLTINNGSATQTLSNGFIITSIEQFTNLYTGAGDDVISFTGRYNDTLNTGVGNDTINVGLGKDSIDGDLGNDLLIIDYSGNTYAGNATYAAGIRWDNFYYQGSGSWTGSLYAYTDTSGNYDQLNFSNIERFQITGTTKNDTLYGGGGNDVLSGNSGNDTLDSGGGNDTLNGGTGADILKGGKGDDLYVVDTTSDAITENLNEGIDTVQSSVTFSLNTTALANVENLTLTGSSVINGTGNALNNVLTGNSSNNTLTGNGGNDTLDGGGGVDTLVGGTGNDLYIVDTTTDVITESANQGTDTVQASVTFTIASLVNVENLTLTGSSAINGTGNTASNVLVGNSANNTLTGDTGNDILNGGAGVDTLVGGTGDDTYIVDTTTDVITENVNEGTDTIQSSVTFSLAALANVENLILTGSNAIDGTGNANSNVLTGNTNNNVLDGSTGSDTLIGGAGDDTYIVDTTTDVITENGNEGTDTIQSSVTFSLASLVNVENLTLTGSNAINGTGNASNNILIGNTANNSLDGGGGNDLLNGDAGIDTLIGGAGDDTYIVDINTDVVTENANEGTDTIQSSVTFSLASLVNVENLALTGSSPINGAGNASNNILTGNTANNILDGGTGVDTLIGGTGDDTYVVDNVADIITENANEGTDTIQSSVTFSLATLPNIENLTLIGSSAIDGTGNANNNIILGNTANNILDGTTGIDTLAGGTGDDTYIVDTTTDTITENVGEGTDTIQSSVAFSLASLANLENLTLTGSNSIDGTGNAANNILTGNSANNLLDGGLGVDAFIGGAGNDTYLVDNSAETITENTGEGTDNVQSSATFSLAAFANVENLTLTGSNAINGTGNGGNNILTGNAANNILDGGAGVDTLIGGTGDDTYIVDSTTDIITENVGAGTDTIQSSVTFTIASLANLENLTLTGSTAINGTGNGNNNILIGNSVNNILNGGAGIDTLIGGLGNDAYQVDSTTDVITENASEGTDTIQSSVTYTIASLGNIENLTLTGSSVINGTGNAANNSLTGNTANNTLDGGDGNDTLIGGAGNDNLIGGNGNDFAYYYSSTATVTVNLATGIASDGLGGTDTLSQIENVQGSNTAGDNLTGNTGVNILYGYGGADILTGGLGNDLLYVGSDTVTDTVNYANGDGADTIYNFVRGVGGDILNFTGITAIDVQVSGTNTLFKLGDGVTGNSGFGTGTLLLTTSATTGFGAADVNVNLSGATFAFS